MKHRRYEGGDKGHMGLFRRNSEICSICNENPGNKKLEDGIVCKKCIARGGDFLKATSWKDTSCQRVKEVIGANELNQNRKAIFKKTKIIKKHLIVDETNRLWMLKSYKNVVFSYDDVLNYELVEKSGEVIKGELEGAASIRRIETEIRALYIRIITKNLIYPQVIIPIITSGNVNPDDPTYAAYLRIAEEFLKAISLMNGNVSKNSIESQASIVVSSADEIAKYKLLLDSGAITQEEYNAKKKQLLGL